MIETNDILTYLVASSTCVNFNLNSVTGLSLDIIRSYNEVSLNSSLIDSSVQHFPHTNVRLLSR